MGRLTWRASRSAAAARARPRSQPDLDRQDLLQRPAPVPHRRRPAPNTSHQVTGEVDPGPGRTPTSTRAVPAERRMTLGRGLEVASSSAAGLDRAAARHGRGHLRRGQDLQRRVPAGPTTRTTSPWSRRPRSMILKIKDETAPMANARDVRLIMTSGTTSSASSMLTLTATGNQTGAPASERIEYRVNGGAWRRRTPTPVAFTTARCTDERRPPRERSCSVPLRAECIVPVSSLARVGTQGGSDEFIGTHVGWELGLVHTRTGGARPPRAALAPMLGRAASRRCDEELLLQLDAGAAADRARPGDACGSPPGLHLGNDLV